MSDGSKNILWFLCDLSSMDKSDIESGEFDVIFEGDDGRDHAASVSITELAKCAYDKIEELHEESAFKSAENEALKKQVDDLQAESDKQERVLQGAHQALEEFLGWDFNDNAIESMGQISLALSEKKLRETQEAAARIREGK